MAPKMSRQEMLDFIEGKNLCEIIAWINSKLPPPFSFHYYTNLCSQDMRVHWDLHNDNINAQSDDCLAFIVEALTKK